MIDNDYYVFTSRRGERPERWSWEIRRKSKTVGRPTNGRRVSVRFRRTNCGERALG